MFELDPEKSAANFDKHGIDFEVAQLLWLDQKRLEIDARSDPEPRIAIIAKLGGKHLTAYITMRGNIIRIISVRRSRAREIEHYDSQND